MALHGVVLAAKTKRRNDRFRILVFDARGDVRYQVRTSTWRPCSGVRVQGGAFLVRVACVSLPLSLSVLACRPKRPRRRKAGQRRSPSRGAASFSRLTAPSRWGRRFRRWTTRRPSATPWTLWKSAARAPQPPGPTSAPSTTTTSCPESVRKRGGVVFPNGSLSRATWQRK